MEQKSMQTFSELEVARKNIDAIDQQIAKLLDLRFNFSICIAVKKLHVGKDVLDASREKVVLENVTSCVSSQFKAQVLQVFDTILNQSKSIQYEVMSRSKK